MTTSARHETRALLRAHLAAATGYRHLTRHCPVCHQLLRLAMESPADGGDPQPPRESARDARSARNTRTAAPRPVEATPAVPSGTRGAGADQSGPSRPSDPQDTAESNGYQSPSRG
ncbi:DUF6274 family protein [Streptomyces sp. 8N706]|uniref:DUF6274 family protein n=1 Tax=Streptomyces sp. 8N706 TaxID=3457416 RepID=UPI003FD0D145